MSRFGSMPGGFAGLSMFGRPGTSGTVGYFGQRLWTTPATLASGSTYNYFNSLSMDVRDYGTYQGGETEGFNVPWVVPTGVTSISIVCIGAGGGCCSQQAYVISSGGGGGGLAYENDVPVTPGETLYLTYGRGRAGSSLGGYGAVSIVWRGTPFFQNSQILCGATGGGSGTSIRVNDTTLNSYAGQGGVAYIPGIATVRTDSGFYVTSKRAGSGTTPTGGYGAGGYGGNGISAGTGTGQPMYGGGGAGGYGGNGGNGAGYGTSAIAGINGGGGGGGRGTINTARGGAGGGTSPYGNLGNGAAGTNGSTAGTPGGGGTVVTTYKGSYYGGGGAGIMGSDFPSSSYSGAAGAGGNGVIRIIWPGSSRKFPSTNTADV